MDRRRLIIGGSLMVLVFGMVLLGFGEGGIFNPVVPYHDSRFLPASQRGHRPDLAYRDLSRSAPLLGLLLPALGGIGLIYGWAVRSPE